VLEVGTVATFFITQRTPQHRADGTSPSWWSRGVIVALEVPIGVGGLAGGSAMLRDPLHPLDVTPALLDGTPFDDYTWPGFFLIVLVALPSLLLAVALLARVRGAVALSSLYGVGLMAWIVVQWLLIDDRLWLQPVVFCVGAVLAATAAAAMRRGAR
jgi:hypothetical protein